MASASSTRLRDAAAIGASGRRVSPLHRPSLAAAYFTGPGLDSTNSAVVQRHQPVLELERETEIAGQARELELGAERGRDIGGDRDAARPAMRHEAESGRVLAGELDEVRSPSPRAAG